MIKKNNISLIIAGSDSGAGAGLQADLKTFTVHNVYAATVITALTAQNTLGVDEVLSLPSNFIESQIRSIVSDFKVSLIKIGMLSNLEIIKKVDFCLDNYLPNIPIVLDPVMIAKGGQPLIEENAISYLINKLMPKCYLLTPNIPEAEKILNCKLNNTEEVENNISRFYKLGVKNVLIKGGHLIHKNKNLVDILCEEKKTTKLYSKFIKTNNTHGTGCSLASSITSNLFLGKSLVESVKNAQRYIYEGIKYNHVVGSGHNPINHFYKFKK